jgi:ethanolamine ammonia-lyase small subunit
MKTPPALPELKTAADLRTLRDLTAARIGLHRSGSSIATPEILAFDLDHARARDAVHLSFDVAGIERGLRERGLQPLSVHSAAADRTQYLQRPDLGRRLSAAARETLRASAGSGADNGSVTMNPATIALVIADGLSTRAIHDNALPFLDAWLPLCAQHGWLLTPPVIASQARVALADEIGAELRARLSLILIGERPGLSAADSMGIYLTYAPCPGRSDAERNCISNVRPGGLSYQDAAELTTRLVAGALQRGITGVELKDDARLNVQG